MMGNTSTPSLLGGRLYQLHGAAAVVAAAAPDVVKRIEATPGRLDLLIDGVAYEFKRGFGGSVAAQKEALQRAMKQIVNYKKSGLANQMQFVVKDASDSSLLGNKITEFMNNESYEGIFDENFKLLPTRIISEFFIQS